MSRGSSLGSSWRSPSMVTTTSPRQAAKPCDSAADLPKLRRSLTTRTSARAAARRRMTSNEPSLEPSSTNTISKGWCDGASA